MLCKWTEDGRAFMLWYGLLYSEGDIVAKQTENKIPSSWVGIDCGWGAVTRDVYRMCAKRGWTAMRGSDENSFTHYVKKKDGRTVSVERSWRSFKGDPEAGAVGQRKIFARGLRWSNFTIKSHLARLINKGRWIEPKAWPDDKAKKRYQSEMAAEKLRVVKRKTDGKLIRRFEKVGPNHAWDCACEQTVIAKVRGRVPDLELEQKAEEEAKTES
jgi:hypothetical protein